MTVLNGTNGWVHAYDASGRLPSRTGMHYANPVKIEVVDDIKGIKLIIPLPDHVDRESQPDKTTPRQ